MTPKPFCRKAAKQPSSKGVKRFSLVVFPASRLYGSSDLGFCFHFPLYLCRLAALRQKRFFRVFRGSKKDLAFPEPEMKNPAGWRGFSFILEAG
jgi:hypothetical protein